MSTQDEDHSDSQSDHDLPGREPQDLSSGLGTFEYPDIDGYIIESKLGEGAHGRVFKALDMSLRKPVAIKVLNPIASGNKNLRERFDRELRACHSLKDGHVIQLRSYGQVTAGAYKNCPYMVMEFMDGGTFGDWMTRNPAVSKASLRASIEILVEVCKGLKYLHDHGIIHRDLKPDNILLAELTQDSEGQPEPRQVRLCDFGLIANLSETRDLSRTGMGAGTPAYMSPEQFVDSKHITPASDQYAIGVMLYQLLCTRRPWQSSADEPEAQGVLEAKALSKTPCPPPSSSSGKVDARLREICLRCLEPNPAERYENVTHLRESLEAWTNDEIDPHSRSWLKRTWRTKVLHPIRRRPGRFLTCVAAAIFFVTSSYWTWHQYAYVWTQVSYYHDVVERWGVLQGIQPLNLVQVSQRPHSYRITQTGRKGRIVKVERVNGHLVLVENPDRYVFNFVWGDYVSEHHPFEAFRHSEVSYEYSYTTRGTLATVVAKSNLDTPLWRLTYREPHVAKYESLLPIHTLETVDIMDPATGVPGDNLVSIEYDAKGLARKVVVTDEQGNSIRSYTQTHDDQGRITRRNAIHFEYSDSEITIAERDSDGELRTDGMVAKYCIKLDALKCPVELSYYGDSSFNRNSGRQVTGSMGEFIRCYSYNQTGDLTLIRYLNQDRSATINYRGVSSVEMKYDDQGREVATNFLGVDKVPIADNDGAGGSRTVYDDAKGSAEKFSVDTQGLPIGTRRKLWRDPQGRIVQMASFNPDSTPAVDTQGVHQIKGTLGDTGFVKTIEYFDHTGERMVDQKGIAIIERVPDDLGRVFRQRYYDNSNQPAALPDGEYGREITYDSHGRETYVKFLGPDGTLADTEAGYAFYQNLWELNDRRWFNQLHEQVVPVLQVIELNADSNAAQAGIALGDEILFYNHQRVEYYAALTWMIRHQQEGPVDIGVLRDGKLVHLPASSGPLGVRLREHYIPLSDLIIAEAAKGQSTRKTE